MTGRYWSKPEDEALISLYPDYSAVQLALPRRSLSAIKSRSAFLGIQAKRHIWTTREIALVRQHYPAASAQELEAHIGLPFSTIEAKACAIGVPRDEFFPLRPTGIKLLDLLLTRCREQRVTMPALDRLAGTGTFFRGRQWGKSPRTEALHRRCILQAAKAVRALGGTIVADWEDDDESAL